MPETIRVYPHNESAWGDPTTLGTIIVGILLSAFFVQRSLEWLHLPFESIFEALWNLFVRLTPTSLVMLHAKAVPHNAAILQNPLSPAARAEAHALKSDVLRSVLQLDRVSTANKDTFRDYVPKGLGNWDNSCYQNSVLQSLASIVSFRDFLLPFRGKILTEPDASTSEALLDLMQSLNDGDSKHRHIWTPPKLKSMSSWQQQDAQEYYSKIMDAVEKDIAGVQALQNISQGISAFLSLQDSTSSRAGDSRINLASVSHTPFGGLLAQRVGCTRCGFSEGLSTTPFNCITLPLERGQTSRLSTSFDLFCQLETIEGVECAKCTLLKEHDSLREYMAKMEDDEDKRKVDLVQAFQQKLEWAEQMLADSRFEDPTVMNKCSKTSKTTTDKTRQAAIMRAPQCLVLHLNRSIFDETTFQELKNFAHVEYPRILDIGRWCVGDSSSAPEPLQRTEERWLQEPTQSMIQTLGSRPSNVQYELRSVVTHYGRHDNGHYVAYRKLDPRLAADSLKRHPNIDLDAMEEKWWRISDESVRVVDEAEALSQGGAFMLFYERLSPEDVSKRRFDDPCKPDEKQADATVDIDTDPSSWSEISEINEDENVRESGD